jgi:hypothetical protein
VSKHFLPSKLPSYLRRLAAEYANDPQRKLELEVVSTCRARVEAETEYDNWNGGTYGHDVWLYLPLELLGRIGLRNLNETRQALLDDLKLLSQSVPNEFFSQIHLEEIDEEDFGFQIAQPASSRPAINPESVAFWKTGLVRLFISHRDTHKAKANQLARALEKFGISCFVAHDTIKPMSEWRKEIMKGLETMEAMLVFLTDDFADSVFTNQEVGFAIGANKPIISLKLERKDPPGFISHEQALRGDMNDPVGTAKSLYPLISKAIGNADRLNDGLIAAFASAANFDEARDRFDLLAANIDKLEQFQLEAIVSAYEINDQLHNSIYLNNNHDRLKRYLERATGRKFEVGSGRIKEIAKRKLQNDDLPF